MRFVPVTIFISMLLSACAAVPPGPCAETCQGCCTVEGRCEGGASTAACGLGGSTCQSCAADQSCAVGACRGGSGGPVDAGTSLDGGTDGGAIDACAGVVCRAPPGSACTDAQTIRVFDAVGTCREGQCEYSSRTEPCAGGCANDVCSGAPCQGVTCQTPPGATCSDASTLRTFQAPGTCSAGTCQYLPVDLACPSGCLNGACRADPCLGVTCAAPPASTCLSPGTLRTFSAPGTCAAGTCSYLPRDVACPFGCANGACAGDPCLGVTCSTPPASTCLDASTLRTFQASGSCSGGSCAYTPQDLACAFGCANGACAGDPCLGVTCATPPAATCVNATTRRAFTAPGTCAAGRCTFAPVETTCGVSEVCQTGRCAWNDAGLTGLSVTPGTLAFAPTQTSYAVTVPVSQPSVVVTALVAQPARAIITVNGSTVMSGAATTVPLSGAVTTISVRVEAESGAFVVTTVLVTRSGTMWELQPFSSNPNLTINFGFVVAMSADGNTVAVGAPTNGVLTTNSGPGSVYVFVRGPSGWTNQARLVPSNAASRDTFGFSLSLSADGDTLAVGASGEDSGAVRSGATYVFGRTGATWSQRALLKASNAAAFANFGASVSLSADGNTLVVGAAAESSNATGVNGNQADRSLTDAGAAYVFVRVGPGWTQQAYLKASNTGADDGFGSTVALSGDGNTLAVTAPGEDSDATGVGGNQLSNAATASGAVYVFARSGSMWSQQAYVKASNTGAFDEFGGATSKGLALSHDGATLAVGAAGEDSNATGLNGNQSNNSAVDSGAVYLFLRGSSGWAQQAFVKPSNTAAGNAFGASVALSALGDVLAVGSPGEFTEGFGLTTPMACLSPPCLRTGAVYVFGRSGAAWSQDSFVKSLSTSPIGFGRSVAMSQSAGSLIGGAQSDRAFVLVLR